VKALTVLTQRFDQATRKDVQSNLEHKDHASLTSDQLEILRLLLTQIYSLRSLGKPFQSWVETYLTHPVAMIRSSAIETYVAMKPSDASSTLRALLNHNEPASKLDTRSKEAILKGLAKLEGVKSIPLLIESAQDPYVTLDVISLLKKIGSSKALPFLDQVAKKHYNRYTRLTAKRAAQSIRKRKAKRPSKKKKGASD